MDDMKSDFAVKLEVFEPKSGNATLRVGIPAEALRALAENGIGQFGITDESMREVIEIGHLLVEVERDPITPRPITELQERQCANGDLKFEGWLGATAGSHWWDNRKRRHEALREQFASSMFTEVSEFVHDFEAANGVLELIKRAYDAGAGRST
jgi:hypothetical protein